ncbi:MAG: RIP metalloprotease RseP [Clostridia bacterium]|nr:RIP metalloprotease RseP [Clostridia bacterium]
MLTFLITIVKLLVILCIVATIHEFGHFLAAKAFKIGVNEFSIGYGPKIFQKKYKETVYSLRWIPLGGYVMIEGEGEESESENSFEKKHPLKRIIVLSMGVIFNFILGFIVLMSVSAFVPVYTTEITELSDSSPLIEAGITVGDKITKINSKDVTFASDLVISNYDGPETVEIEYLHLNEKRYVVASNVVKKIGYMGVAFISKDETVVNSVAMGSAAESAGIKAKDRILSINGNALNNSTDIISVVQSSAGISLNFEIERDGKVENLVVIPNEQSRFDLGVLNTKEEKSNIYYSLKKALNTIKTVIDSYVQLFQGKVGINDVSSIVGIGVVVSKTSGILEYLNMLALISLAVGAANILPFVPLDGGKIVFVLYEWISRRKPSEKFEIIVTYIGWGLLLMLTVVVTFKDVMNIF